MSVNLCGIVILNIKSADYCCNISGNAKYQLDRKKQNIIKLKFIITYKNG